MTGVMIFQSRVCRRTDRASPIQYYILYVIPNTQSFPLPRELSVVSANCLGVVLRYPLDTSVQQPRRYWEPFLPGSVVEVKSRE